MNEKIDKENGLDKVRDKTTNSSTSKDTQSIEYNELVDNPKGESITPPSPPNANIKELQTKIKTLENKLEVVNQLIEKINFVEKKKEEKEEPWFENI